MLPQEKILLSQAMLAKYLLCPLQTSLNPVCCLERYLKYRYWNDQINLIYTVIIRCISKWLRSFLIFTVMLVDKICMTLIFLEMACYSSLTLTNSPLAAGVLPVWMNIVNHSQNFRKANLSGVCVSDSVCFWKFVFEQSSLRCSVFPLSASAEFALCTGVLRVLRRTD